MTIRSNHTGFDAIEPRSEQGPLRQSVRGRLAGTLSLHCMSRVFADNGPVWGGRLGRVW